MTDQLVPLSDLLDVSDSGTWGDEDTTDGISVLRSTNFNSDGTLDLSKLAFRAIEPRKRDSKLLQPGDILLEKSGGGPMQPVGRVCLFRGDERSHSFGNFIARLRAKPAVDPEFLFYFLWRFHATGSTSQYQKQTTGIRNLEFKRYLTLQVPVPPLPEQRRIVDLLSRADGIVRLRLEAKRKAAELVPVLFLDTFGDPASNPKAWPVVAFSEIAETQLGKMLDKKKQTGLSSFPYLGNSNVRWDGFKLKELLEMDFSDREREKFRLRDGDLLVCEGGEVGRAAIWRGQMENCYYQKALHRVRPNPSLATPEFLLWWLWHMARQGHLENESAKATIAHLPAEKLRALKVAIPSIELQRAFTQKAEAIRRITNRQAAALATAQAAFDALLQRAFAR